jgi:hypothetical protein
MQEVVDEFCKCPNPSHNSKNVGSLYSADKVPKKMFLKNPEDPSSKICKRCYDCRKCQRNTQQRNKETLKEKARQSLNNEYQFCPCPTHTVKNVSNYPRDKVPKTMFRKDPQDPKSEIYQSCSDCRKYSNIKNKITFNKYKEKAEESKAVDSEFCFCASQKHNVSSKIKQDEVPRHMFRKYPDDPKSPLFEYCLDCREATMERHYDLQDRKKEALKQDEFLCSYCHYPIHESQKYTRLDGTPSTFCLCCAEKRKIVRENNSESVIKIKHEMMLINDCSCLKCKKIYLVPEANTKFVVELDTYQIKNKRYVKYKENTFEVREFLTQFKNLLEFRIMEFDHLSEQEQRERNIIGKHDIYFPKKGSVSTMGSEDSMRWEARKTQLICCKCHVEETIRREAGIIYRSKLEQKKLDYVNKIKKKGCSVCGFYDEKLHRFLDLDHLNPYTKRECVSRMVKDSKYTLDDVIQECDDAITRVVCKHCHFLHTDYQRNEGIL